MSPNSRRRIPDGVASIVRPGGPVSAEGQYNELNRYGLCFGREQFARVRIGKTQDSPWVLNFQTPFRLLARTLTCARRFYTASNYSGALTIQAGFHNARNEVMVFLSRDPFFSDLNLDDFRCVTGDVSSTQFTSAEELKDHWRVVLCRVLTELTWSFWQSFEEFPTEELRRTLEAATQRMG